MDESSEEEFFEEFFLPIIGAETLESTSDDEDDGQWWTNGRRRRCLTSGAGTNRENRARPRPFISADNGGVDIRRHSGMDAKRGRIYFNLVAPPRPGSLAWDTFREKFRLPFPMFNWIIECAREDGRFPFDSPPSRGHDPTPMCLKVAVFFVG